VVETGVLDIGEESAEVIDDMIDVATDAVERDGAEAVIPGCMSLAFIQVQDRIADELGVPFLDPVAISLEMASTWARHDITHSRLTYPEFDRDRHGTIFD
jgi:allantoin racemase